MKKQNGFTLIELVVVIIILGILAVTAAPKFINLQSDARKSTLSGIEAALKGANSLVYSKAVIQGKEKVDGDTTENIDTTGDGTADLIGAYGYVKGTASEVADVLDVSADEWTVAKPSTADVSGANVIIHAESFAPTKDSKCFVEYTEAASPGASPTYKVVDDNC